MRSRKLKRELYTLYFSIGGFAVIWQTILLREFLVVFSGNELTLGVVFAFWLLGVTLGAYLGGKIARRYLIGIGSLFLAFSFFAICASALLVFIRGAKSIFDIQAGQVAPFGTIVLSALLTASPAAFPIGLFFPMAAKCAHQMGIGEKSIGVVYSFEAVGATVGGVVFTYLLVGRFDSFTILGGTFLAASTLYLVAGLFSGKLPSLIMQGVFIIVVAVLLVVGVFENLDQRCVNWRWTRIAPGLTLLENKDSKYQNLAAGRLFEQYSIYGNGEVFTSFPDPHGYETDAHFIACQHPAPKDMLIIGAGGESLVRFLLLHAPRQIDVVENDPVATKMIFEYLGKQDRLALSDSRVHLITDDGRWYVKTTQHRYDLVILNLPDPTTAMINRFYTLDFFRQLKRVMKPGGVVTCKVISSENYVGAEVGRIVGSIFVTLSKIFENVIVLPGDTARFFASDRPDTCTENWEVLQSRYVQRGFSDGAFSPVMFKFLMPKQRITAFREGLNDYKAALPNTDNRPIAYFYNLILWDQFSGSRIGGFLSRWHQKGPWPALFVIMVVGMLWIYRIRTTKRGSPERSAKALTTGLIFTTGFVGMGFEIEILMAFQNVYGSLYARIGLLVAMYMLGLGAGGGFVTFQLNRLKNHYLDALILTEIIILVLLAGFSFLCGNELAAIVFYGAILMMGVAAGAQFPLAAAYFRQKSTIDVAEIAGRIDWADHFGAFLGAALTGVVFIPVFGMGVACLIMAAMKLLSIVSLGFEKL